MFPNLVEFEFTMQRNGSCYVYILFFGVHPDLFQEVRGHMQIQNRLHSFYGEQRDRAWFGSTGASYYDYQAFNEGWR